MSCAPSSMATPDRRLLLSRLYYGVDTANPRADVHGDALLRDLVAPLVAELRAALPYAVAGWMRFCAGGYHLQLQVMDEEHRLRALAQPMIDARMRAFVAAHPGHFAQPMALPALARQVSGQFAPGRDQAQPGTCECALYPLPAAPYKSPAQFFLAQQLMQPETLQTLAWLEREGAYGVRYAFWRLYTVQLLQLCALGGVACEDLLLAWAGKWRAYFSLDEQALRARADRLPLCAQLGQQLAGGAPLHAWPLLPAALGRDLHGLWCAQQAPACAWRASAAWDGDMALQLIMFLHLSANRLGVSISDESAHAIALHDALRAVRMPSMDAAGLAGAPA